MFMGLAVWILGCPSVLAEPEENYRCGKGSDVRRIEIRFENEDGDLPCRVIYRPEFESDTIGTVSWRDIADLEICRAQAGEVVGRLTGEGWNCSLETGDAGSAGHDIQTADLNEPEVQQPDNLGETSDRLLQVTPDAVDDEPAEFIDNPEIAPPSADLVVLINDDLKRLDATVDGKLEAKIADYGDLNADEIEDALVLFSYTSPQPAFRQFLAAYLFDGETYQLTATKPVGGSTHATRHAKVEHIDQGVIHLSLEAFEPGDASCCPTGTRQIALALRNLDLVDVDRNAPTR